MKTYKQFIAITENKDTELNNKAHADAVRGAPDQSMKGNRKYMKMYRQHRNGISMSNDPGMQGGKVRRPSTPYGDY